MIQSLRRFHSHTLFRSFSTIKDIKARQVIDSRGNPTIEVDVLTENNVLGRSIVPSGASTGEFEACELRDEDPNLFGGKSVLTAIDKVNTEIRSCLFGKSIDDQSAIDKLLIDLDGTPNKSRLGANSILGTSLSVFRAFALTQNIPLHEHLANLAGNTSDPNLLPVPCFNVINGGQHAGNSLAFQEFFLIPTGAQSFSEAMRIGCEVFQSLKKLLKRKYGGDATLVGDEGGFAPPVDAKESLELILEATHDAKIDLNKISLGMDVASSEFYCPESKLYDLDFKNKDSDGSKKLSSEQLSDYYVDLIKQYPQIVTIEDPFDQNDWKSWEDFTKRVGKDVQVVGDDLTVTNVSKIQRAVKSKSCNALLLKVNQIGTVSESLDAVKLAKQNGWGVMASHRSGETEDTFIADMAVGWSCGQIKTGGPCRGERTAKYNQLLRIEEELGEKASFAGKNFRTTNWMAN